MSAAVISGDPAGAAVSADGAISAGPWRVDPSHSSVEFRVRHMMLATVTGRFTVFDGVLEADADGALLAHGRVEVASIDTREAKRDEHLRAPDFFDAAGYPHITFVSTEITRTGATHVEIAGDLTIKGATRTIELAGDVVGAAIDPWGNERIALQLHGEIDRDDFGLRWDRALDPGVGRRVSIELDISAVKVPLAPELAVAA